MNEIAHIDHPSQVFTTAKQAIDQHIAASETAWSTARDAQLSLQSQLDDVMENSGESGLDDATRRLLSNEEDRLRISLNEAQRATGIAKLAFMRAVTDAISAHVLAYRKIQDALTVALDTGKSTQHLTAALEMERATIDTLSVAYSQLNLPSVY